MAELRLVLATRTAELARLADEAEAFATACGLDAGPIYRLLTVLDEIVTNVVSHAGLDAASTIEVQLRERERGLDVTVEDAGAPFDPLSDARAPPLAGNVEERPVGGLGIFLVQRLASDVAYLRTPDGRNRLSFRVA
mgnify:FL=1